MEGVGLQPRLVANISVTEAAVFGDASSSWLNQAVLVWPTFPITSEGLFTQTMQNLLAVMLVKSLA
jgi:hypothetical protein